MAKKDTGIFQFEKMDATFRCYQLRSVSGVLQAPSIEMEAEYTVLQVQPSDKVIELIQATIHGRQDTNIYQSFEVGLIYCRPSTKR